jgi:hypothetical protein
VRCEQDDAGRKDRVRVEDVHPEERSAPAEDCIGADLLDREAAPEQAVPPVGPCEGEHDRGHGRDREHPPPHVFGRRAHEREDEADPACWHQHDREVLDPEREQLCRVKLR